MRNAPTVTGQGAKKGACNAFFARWTAFVNALCLICRAGGAL